MRLGALAGGRQKHLREAIISQPDEVTFAARELVVAERIELVDEIEIATELQHRMLADRVVRGEEGSEFEARHGLSLGFYCSCCRPQTTG